MIIKYLSSDTEKYDFDISEFANLIEVNNKLKDLFTNESKSTLKFKMKPPIAKSISLPTVVKAIAHYNNLDTSIELYCANDSLIERIKNYFPPQNHSIKKLKFNKVWLTIQTGDITEIKAEAIVNASNAQLRLGTGVSGAIKAKADSELQDEMNLIASRNEIKNGDAFITSSYGLKNTKYIIHVACADGRSSTIHDSLRNTFNLCNEKNIKSIAIPALGTGTGTMPMEEFAKIFFMEIKSYSERENNSLEKILLVLWAEGDYKSVLNEVEVYE
ncbi:MAG: macro domain-containing protein [Ignavibacteriales bacterium]|nr:macro domain-containing protein [Ignavibacteriales bacterium]